MGIITDILKEIPLSAVLKERLVDLGKRMDELDAENATLKEKLANSEKVQEGLRSKIKQCEEASGQREIKVISDFNVLE